MTAPPDLAEVLAESLGRLWTEEDDADLPDWKALPDKLAQAWRDACTITTVAQLDVLPFLSVIREVFRNSPSGANYGAVYERRTSGWQCIAGTYQPRDPDGTWNVDNGPPRLPALLIWSPGWAR